MSDEQLNKGQRNLEIDVSLHIGSFLAVIVFFRKDIFNFVQNKDLFLKIFYRDFGLKITSSRYSNFNSSNFWPTA